MKQVRKRRTQRICEETVKSDNSRSTVGQQLTNQNKLGTDEDERRNNGGRKNRERGRKGFEKSDQLSRN